MEPKEEIARLNALGERLANGLREAYDTDALKEVRSSRRKGGLSHRKSSAGVREDATVPLVLAEARGRLPN